ncbi:MAG: hypothetical protein N3I35_03130 [Clostridia bacterium]|nr:hypothetical protein [Clostridia bacterium]
MTYTDAANRGAKIIRKNLWLLLIPVVSDSVVLLLNYLSSGVFINISKIPSFQLKFTLPSSLPSLKNIVDAFPDLISFSTNTGFQNSILSPYTTIPAPWSSLYIVCSVLLFSIFTAFLEGGFLGCIANTYRKDEKSSIKDFIHFGCHYWNRFLGLRVIGYLAIAFGIAFLPVIFVYFFVALLIFYLSYALVWDDVSVFEAFTRAVSRFTSRLGNSLGYMIYLAFLLGLLSLVVIPLSRISVFPASILYNVCACYLIAGIMVMYAGERSVPETETRPEDSGSFDIRV